MKERPILFSGPMVRALLAGTKTQTRRIVKPQPDSRPGMECTRVLFKNRKGDVVLDEAAEAKEPRLCAILCPYGQPGDRLWVRETHNTHGGLATYRADGDWIADYHREEPQQPRLRWVPAIHMPRTASRILLEITSVRVERLQDISEADAYAEGIEQTDFIEDAEHQEPATGAPPGRYAYRALWEDINGPDSWAQNPWVWVVEFERAKATEKGKKQ
ncbi:hypothetical protein [Delftia acidovorans]|uniref:hypothetical protein n=1 Tax=Delftia acidovorans TaxID=80866 RepID=UPI0030165428